MVVMSDMWLQQRCGDGDDEAVCSEVVFGGAHGDVWGFEEMVEVQWMKPSKNIGERWWGCQLYLYI